MNNSIAKCLPAFHALTGCDTTSQFSGLGKKTCWRVFLTNYKLLEQFGFERDLSEDVLKDIVKFVIRLYTTCDDIGCINSLRGILASSKSINKLPPTLDSLRQHCLRAHYQTKIWLNSNVPRLERILPDLESSGWKFVDGKVEAILTTSPVLPEDTSVLSTCNCKKGCTGPLCSCKKKNICCIGSCKCMAQVTCSNKKLEHGHIKMLLENPSESSSDLDEF
ncbi:hypothetical protein RI129_008703 [Pyrocoelia pectoralis]|uniref:Tesmin/TSO1-like CXC domain-containing protein n=1 Tax=Pyrocoelia pectoralis TaxID=417401 RepID=A0AAN7VBL0_9COLE